MNGLKITLIGGPTALIEIAGFRILTDDIRRTRRMGSAQTRGPFHLTMDTNDAIETAQAFPVP
jgi:L-ascorbate metabolism protein UlaG (beta-lactamase superfamily)